MHCAQMTQRLYRVAMLHSEIHGQIQSAQLTDVRSIMKSTKQFPWNLEDADPKKRFHELVEQVEDWTQLVRLVLLFFDSDESTRDVLTLVLPAVQSPIDGTMREIC